MKVYLEQSVSDAKEQGYVRTISGRRRNLDKISDRNWNVRRAEERIAVNTKIQGSAADIIKKAMIEIDKELENRNLSAEMLLQVHDELIFEAPLSEMESLQDLVKNLMEDAWKLDLPLRVDMKTGSNWCDLDKI